MTEKLLKNLLHSSRKESNYFIKDDPKNVNEYHSYNVL